ncbi:nucleotide-binding oligomerization domain-containing protein 2 [Plakobranchus ocellatus]|uniref:Nucleotide-binding oligomerization domain-containing protein 2 n=1 Tax=Plakobranchus ocellatus TaxID=259542 RepID=A0AAV4A5U0_9GAST|nr:nucleotide-binding oligomerization domain-containing protein 2 [Plakobranchus ocellatus]
MYGSFGFAVIFFLPGGLEHFQPKDARGVEKTTGKVDINELTSDDESDHDSPRQLAPLTKQKSKGKGRNVRARSASSRSHSTSGSSSESESEQTARGQAQSKVVALKAEEAKIKQASGPVTKSSPPDAGRGKNHNSGESELKGGNEEKAAFVERQAEPTGEKQVDNDDDEKVASTRLESVTAIEEVKEKKDRRDSASSTSSSSSSSSSKSGQGSTRDYSTSGKHEIKGKDEEKMAEARESDYNHEKEEKKIEASALEAAVSIEVDVDARPVEQPGHFDNRNMEEEEKEEAGITVIGEVAEGSEEQDTDMAQTSVKAQAVVEVMDNRDVLEPIEEHQKEETTSDPPVVDADIQGPVQVEPDEVEKPSSKRRGSAASTGSTSSAVSSSSSSGSASIADKAPNTANDPTATAQQVGVQHQEQGSATTQEEKVELSSAQQKSEQPPTSPDSKDEKKDSESEDSESDSSSSDSDNEQTETKMKNNEVDQQADSDVLALLVSKVAEEKSEEEERMRIKKLEEEEERERQRKLQEEEQETRRKMEEEQEKKMSALPSVTISKHASGSSADSSSDSSDDDGDKGNRKKVKASSKTEVIKTEADVHSSDRKQSVTSYNADSDPEATHGGNDPDNVANTRDGSVSPPGPPPASLPLVHPGSIQPLLEKSRVMVEIKGVTLNKSQLYECAEHISSHRQISQVNLVNCGLDDDDLQKVVEALKLSDSNPVLLNLSLNPLTSACVDYILDLLDTKPSIEAILLQGTRLGDAGVEHLIDGLLGQHQQKKEERTESGEPLKELRELDLSDCKIGDDGAKAVARLVRSDMEVDTLTLSSNQAVTEHGWTALGDALSHNTTLETLTLDHNLLGDPGIRAVASGLQRNTSVTALDLNGVGITLTGGQVLLELLKQNTTLLEITLVGNSRLDKATLDNIGKYIALNKTMGGSQTQSQ